MKKTKTKEKPQHIYKTMSIAVSSGKVGMVMFMNKQLAVLKLSVKASKSTEQAKKQMRKWIDQYQPDCIVTEQLDKQSRKHGRTPELIDAMNEVIHQHAILHVEMKRQQDFKNKYEEANALAEQYPQLKPHLKHERKIWQSEEPSMMLFEAVRNVEEVI